MRWACFLLLTSTIARQCGPQDNCTICSGAPDPSCVCAIQNWGSKTKPFRQALFCNDVSGDPFYLNTSDMSDNVEELYFNNNQIAALDPAMFKGKNWTGLFFHDCQLVRLQEFLFEDMPNLQKLEFQRNEILFIDAQFVRNTPRLLRVETEDNLISLDDTCGSGYFLMRAFVEQSEIKVPICWVPCDAGMQNTLVPSNPCELCPKGTYNSELANRTVTGPSVCTRCPSGTFGNVSGATSISQCQHCPPGAYSESSGATQCSYCDQGRFSPTQSQTMCAFCEAGRTTVGPGFSTCSNCSEGTFRVSSLGCLVCEAGRFSRPGSSACSDCGLGTRSASVGAGVCENCAAGKYNSQLRQLNCTLCPAGTFGIQSGAISNESCFGCPPGTFSGPGTSNQCPQCSRGRFSFAGAEQCSECEAGTYSPPQSAHCQNCTSGTYNSRRGQGNCESCQSGRFLLGQQATNQTLCLVCPSGFTCENVGVPPQRCRAGTFRREVGASSTADCVSCAAGEYSAAGAVICQSCPSKTYSKVGSDSLADCLPVESDLRPFVFVAASLLCVVFVLMICARRRDRNNPNRTRINYRAPIFAVWGALDFVSDLFFLDSLRTLPLAPAWSVQLAFAFVVVPFLLSLISLTVVLCREFHHPVFSKWFKRHAASTSAILVVSATNTSIFELTHCGVGGLKAFQAPWSSKTLDLLSFFGLVTNVVEDIPQLALQVYVSQELGWTMPVLVSTSFSALSLVSGVAKHAFLCYSVHLHKGQQRNLQDPLISSINQENPMKDSRQFLGSISQV